MVHELILHFATLDLNINAQKKHSTWQRAEEAVEKLQTFFYCNDE